MSFEYYSQWWAGSRKVLRTLMAKDEALATKLTNLKLKSRPMANQLIGGLFAKYSMVVQDIGQLLDQLAQPQKRETVRKLVDAATIRLHELNDELTNIDISEYHYIDGALVELKLVPQNVEILDPIFYFLREYHLEDMWTKIKNKETIYEPPPPEVVEGEEEEKEEAVVEEEAPEKKKVQRRQVAKFEIPIKTLTAEELAEEARQKKINTITIEIQRMERGRQTRLYFEEKLKEHLYKKAIRDGLKPKLPDREGQAKSAPTIQRYWRGYADRQMLRRKERERRLLIGMTEPSWRSYAEFDKFEANLQKRRDFRDLRIREYIEAHLKEQERVYRVIAPGLFEDIGDEIREWFRQWYVQVKNFDKYPEEEKGGTILVIRGETFTPKEWLDDYDKKRREKVKNKGADKAKLKALKAKAKKDAADKRKKEKEKAKKEAKRKAKKKLKPWDFELELEPDESKIPYKEAALEYRKEWDPRPDKDNPDEKTYLDIIHEEKCYKLQLDIRQQVDVMMRLELELLDAALLRDRGKKPKKAKKKKGKKGKKKKGKKDMTANRTIEDLFQELANNDIIHAYPSARLSDFKGDISYANWDLRIKEFDPPASLGDVRQVVKIHCILPLSTTRMKKARSVLLMGPRQTGKHVLANAIISETRSVLFDLSPENTAGKYEGKAGMKMLMHLIDKMSKILQPSIIYFPYVEKIFYKKVPANEKDLDPKRIGKKLFAGIVKLIKPEDRVLVLGVTGQPQLAQAAKLKKTFDKIIMVPRPDYGTIYLYWRELLMPYHGVDRDFDVSCLATMSKWMPLPEIKRAVDEVMTPRRIIQLKYRPLRAAELFEPLIDTLPVTDKDMKKLFKIYNKTPLAKERNRFNKYADKKREQEAKANEKPKK